MVNPAASSGESKEPFWYNPWVVVAMVVVVGTAMLIGIAALRPRHQGSQGPVLPSEPTTSAPSVSPSAEPSTPTPSPIPSPTCMPDAEHGKAWRCSAEQRRWQQVLNEQQDAAFKAFVAALNEGYQVFGDPRAMTVAQIKARLARSSVDPHLSEASQSLAEVKGDGVVAHGVPGFRVRSYRWIKQWTSKGGSQLVIGICQDGRSYYTTDRSGGARVPGVTSTYIARMIHVDGGWKLQAQVGIVEVPTC